MCWQTCSLFDVASSFFKIYIHHTIFTNFTYINIKNSLQQSQNRIVVTLTKVDNLHTLHPLSFYYICISEAQIF